MQQTDSLLKGFLLLVFIFANSWVAYQIGKQSTVTKVEMILDAEHSVSTDNISIEDVKLEISKLR
jgi:hypothetical protein|nr:MAG: hypothetical protein [Caudoviricetes sp.]